MFTCTPVPFAEWSTFTVQGQPKVVTQPTNIALPLTTQEEVKDLQIKEWQINWYNKAKTILQRSHGYIDYSQTRSGKTYVSLKLALDFNWRVLVIAPVIALDVWERTAKEYGVEVVDTISYQTLRSKTGFALNHPYLTRHDYTTEGGIKQVRFTPTQRYLDLINEGIFVILDEIQYIKKDSDQYRACAALLNPINTYGGLSRYALVSNTALCDEEHTKYLLRLCGCIKSQKLYSGSGNNINYEGIQELANTCASINLEETTKIFQEIPAVKGSMDKLCIQLYARVVRDYIGGGMMCPKIAGEYLQYNGYFMMPEENSKRLSAAIRRLANAVQYIDGQSVGINRNNLGEVTLALVDIEFEKLCIFIRRVTQDLTSSSTRRCIISLNYKKENMPMLIHYLSRFNPLIVHGEIDKRVKHQIIAEFVKSKSKHRILIMTTGSCGVGVSLYNELADSDVTMYVSPSYHFLTIMQAVTRIRGPGMISNATVFMVYGKGDAVLESGIMASIQRKSETLKLTQGDEMVENTTYPDEWPNYVEEIGMA